MPIAIAVDDLSGPEIAAFLDEHLQHMRTLSPPESTHALDLDALRAPGVVFWTVRESDGEGGGAGDVVGCGALKALDATHAELKSMRTRPARQRGGVASALLAHIIAEATARGFTRLSLETGSDEPFLPARRLYAKFGFTECAPFADYRLDPYSTFMTRTLG